MHLSLLRQQAAGAQNRRAGKSPVPAGASARILAALRAPHTGKSQQALNPRRCKTLVFSRKTRYNSLG